MRDHTQENQNRNAKECDFEKCSLLELSGGQNVFGYDITQESGVKFSLVNFFGRNQELGGVNWQGCSTVEHWRLGVDFGFSGSPMRGRQRGLLIGCWVRSDGHPDRPFGTVIPGRPAFSRTVVVRRENV